VPFFETSFLTSLLPKKEGNLALPMMEIRTKSNNIKPLLDLGFVPKNTEIAFSLNPQILVDKYEE
jgi:hypothetical protein